MEERDKHLIEEHIKHDEELYFAATRKAVPGLIQEIAGNGGSVEKVINEGTFFEFNSRETPTGKIGPFEILAELVQVNCCLLSPVSKETSEDGE